MNNKGYVLVEIILASVIAFGIAYFIVDLTIKLKNKNDDMLVEILVETDRSIIANKIMSHLYAENDEFDCGKLGQSDKKIIYDGETMDIVTDYAKVGVITCDDDGVDEIHIKVPIDVPQMKKNFDLELYYRIVS